MLHRPGRIPNDALFLSIVTTAAWTSLRHFGTCVDRELSRIWVLALFRRIFVCVVNRNELARVLFLKKNFFKFGIVYRGERRIFDNQWVR
ncbi:unnamed protein product [Tuber melanosporum]|uniref:(Perigord truffle) hypothetical protein n=1 Tax=Tuber melanosporum (strain Mel28) TaxID=656061 RepID=D5GHF5_TUBMM|nr:uncharacterized protein GSTUM_00007917001 [Tuber melanosporum]CAZ83948.1 unnamed protein product [Tuber melanosporum]